MITPPDYNEFDVAFIRAGIKRLSYDPCKLCLVEKRFKCNEIFVFLVKSENVLTMLQETQIKKPKLQVRKINKCFFNKHLYYEPCCHYNYDEEPKDINCADCGCSTRGFCDIYCGCDPQKCKRRRQGCKCIRGQCKTKKCACFLMGMECDPEHCKECFDTQNDRCRNNEYLYQRQERTVIGMSFVCPGLGLYNVFPIPQNALVLQYLGEYVSEDEQIIRESWLKSDIFYTFTKNDYEKLVDSKYFGNKSRFMNHHKLMENCFARSVYSRGDYHLGLYAKQDIPPGNELLFDYDADRTLATDNLWITRLSYSNYKLRKDNIRIVIPRNKDLSVRPRNYIAIDTSEGTSQSFVSVASSEDSIQRSREFQGETLKSISRNQIQRQKSSNSSSNPVVFNL